MAAEKASGGSGGGYEGQDEEFENDWKTMYGDEDGNFKSEGAMRSMLNSYPMVTKRLAATAWPFFAGKSTSRRQAWSLARVLEGLPPLEEEDPLEEEEQPPSTQPTQPPAMVQEPATQEPAAAQEQEPRAAAP